MQHGERPDSLVDVIRGWFLGYPNDVGRPTLKPDWVQALRWMGFAAVLGFLGGAFRRRRSVHPPSK
jgi:hypothetical protein